MLGCGTQSVCPSARDASGLSLVSLRTTLAHTAQCGNVLTVELA